MVPKSNFIPPWKRKTDTVNASATKTIFTQSLSEFRSLKLILSASNSTEDKTRQIEMTIINVDGDVKDSIRSRLGANPSFSISAYESSGDLKIDITNNESYNIGVNFIYAAFKAVL